MSAKEKMAEAARQGKFLAAKCQKCGLLRPQTTYFCGGCGGRDSEDIRVDGSGVIATYTIITVPPAGFERFTPYAFVVLKLDGADLRVSGFMGGISEPADLPVGSRARIAGFDERGILVEAVK